MEYRRRAADLSPRGWVRMKDKELSRVAPIVQS